MYYWNVFLCSRDAGAERSVFWIGSRHLEATDHALGAFMLLKAFHGGTVCFTVAGIWLLLLAGLWGDGAYAGQLLAQYPGPDDPPQRFSHMVIDQKTQRVFVGGTNRLLQVNTVDFFSLFICYSRQNWDFRTRSWNLKSCTLRRIFRIITEKNYLFHQLCATLIIRNLHSF